MKKYLLAFLALGAPCAVLADSSVPAALTTALGSLQTGVTDVIDAVVPVVAAILVALLAFVGLFMAWKYVRKAAGK